MTGAGGARKIAFWSQYSVIFRQLEGSPPNIRLHLTAPRESLFTFSPRRIASGAILFGNRARFITGAVLVTRYLSAQTSVRNSARAERPLGAASEPEPLAGQRNKHVQGV